MNIISISNTPLVGAPARLANCLSNHVDSIEIFTIKDYPNHLKGIFPLGKLFDKKVFDLNNVDLLLIHNIVDTKIIEKIRNTYKCPIYLLVHSGVYEEPFHNKIIDSDYLKIFDKKFVVAQAWSRLYSDFIMLPNTPEVMLFEKPSPFKKMKIFYNPASSKSTGRFGRKSYQETKIFIDNFMTKNYSYQKRVEFIIPNAPVKQFKLLKNKIDYHITIDEIVTGGFHQATIEAIVTGGVGVANPDFLSLMSYSASIYADEIAPIKIAKSYDQLQQILSEYVLDPDILIEDMRLSKKFAQKYLTPERLGKIILGKF